MRPSRLAPLAALGAAAAAAPSAAGPSQLPARALAELSAAQSVWLENLLVRANGDVLATSLGPSATLWGVRQNAAAGHASNGHTLFAAYTFPNTSTANPTALLGIAEDRRGRVIVAGGRLDPSTMAPESGSMGLWELSPSAFPSSSSSSSSSYRASQQPRKLASLPGASLLNGVALTPDGSAALVADSFNGKLWRVSLGGGPAPAVEEVMAGVEEMRPRNATEEAAVGVNGLKFALDGSRLYWSNTDRRAIYSVEVDASGRLRAGAGAAPAPAKAVDLADFGVDDFAIDARGDIWAATNTDKNMVVFAAAAAAGNDHSQAKTVLGGPEDPVVAGSTAVAFGRTPRDRHVLYVTTTAASKLAPAKIVAVDTAAA